MKTRGIGVKALTLVGLTVLISALWLLASFRGSGKSDGRGEARISPAAASGAANSAHTKQDPQWAEAYGRLPLSFEENVGQTAQEVRYVSHGSGYELFLTPQEAVLGLRAPVTYDLGPRHRFETLRAIRESLRARRMTAVRMRFEGANPEAQISATGQLAKKTNYFVGNDPKKWHTDVASYGRVRYANIYPGVDLVFYGNQRRLEYDFVVAAGADPRAIRLSLQGARRLRVSARGDVVVSVAGGELTLQKPFVYQMVKGERREVVGQYRLGNHHQVTFLVPSYDRHKPLILDPVLDYSTYLGGSSNDQGLGIALDSAGDTYVTGTTFSTDFPTTAANAFNAGPLGTNTGGAVFVTEMNPTATAEIYSTYLAGTGGDQGFALAIDSSGKIYVTGLTLSTDFPTTANGLKSGTNAGNVGGTSFISKIDPTLSGVASLVYSSYLGGTDGTGLTALDTGQAVAVDANGIAYVAGFTDSTPGAALSNFPVLNGFQTNLNTADGNAFLSAIDTTKSGSASLLYSTYLGGNGANAANLFFGDAAFGVTVDSSGNAYLAGATSSTNFPTTASGYQTAAPASNVNGTCFVARIDTTKTGNASLIYSTYLGGNSFEESFGIALEPNNVNAIAYVTGTTSSTNFPTFPAGAFQTSGNVAGVAFLSLVDTGGSGVTSLKYSTYLGGTGIDTGTAIRADSSGNGYVAGSTSSRNFPVTLGALEPAYPGGQADGFLSKINPAGGGASDLVYSTYFGGNGGGSDQIDAVVLDTSTPANAYITGQTFAAATTFPIFPNPGAFQTTLNGNSDSFIAKLTPIPTLAVSPTSLNFGTVNMPSTSPAQTVTLTNNTNATIAFTSATIPVLTATPAAAATDYVVSANTCAAGVPTGVSPANQCTISVTFKPSVVGAETATLLLTDGDSTSPQSISLTGTGAAAGPGVGLAPTPLPFGGEMLTTTSAAQPVTLTNSGTGALTISSIAASGDFAETSTGATACPIGPATLAAGANCVINVTFAPTVVGARAGNLTVTDNAPGSPHTVPLTGTGWDFSLAGPAQAPPAITTAAPGNFNITMTPLGGFNQNVALTCAVTPAAADATCTVASPVKAADGVTVQTAAVKVTTTALMVPPGSVPAPPVSIRQVVPLILALLLLLLLPRTKRLQVRLGMAGAMLLLVILAGCSGPGTPVLQPVPSVLTITGTTSGTPPGVVTHQATVNLTIN